MDKAQVYEMLKEKGIEFEVSEHEAVFNMEELDKVDLLYPEDDAKNLFIRDDKKKTYYLITVKGNKRVDTKEFRKKHGTRPLTFASSDDLMAIMKLIPGAVSPFGILNDEERKVVFYLDKDFTKGSGRIGCHPNDNTATVFLKTKDLIKLIEEHGNEVEIVEI